MRLRSALVIVVLLLVTAACERGAAPDQALADLGEAARSQLLEEGRLRAAMGVATASLDVMLNTSSGSLPAKAKLSAAQSNGGSTGGTEGIVAAVLAANVTDLLASQRAANPFRSIVLSVKGGPNGTGKYDPQLMGAYACTTAPSSKNIKGTIKLKGTTNQPAGVGAVVALARIPLTLLGISASEFADLCDELAGQIPGLLPAEALRDQLEAVQ